MINRLGAILNLIMGAHMIHNQEYGWATFGLGVFLYCLNETRIK